MIKYLVFILGFTKRLKAKDLVYSSPNNKLNSWEEVFTLKGKKMRVFPSTSNSQKCNPYDYHY